MTRGETLIAIGTSAPAVIVYVGFETYVVYGTVVEGIVLCVPRGTRRRAVQPFPSEEFPPVAARGAVRGRRVVPAADIVIAGGEVDGHFELRKQGLRPAEIPLIEKVLQLALVNEIAREKHEFGVYDVDVLDDFPEIDDFGGIRVGSALIIIEVCGKVRIRDMDEVVIVLELRNHLHGIARSVLDPPIGRDHKVIELVNRDRRDLDLDFPPQGG